MTEPDSELPSLLQLASSALPIGGFGYSSGLEAAVDQGSVHDRASAFEWIEGMLQSVWASGEARHWPRLYDAFANDASERFTEGNQLALAMRETAELRLESEQTGRSLALWLCNLSPLALSSPRHHLLMSLRPIAHVAAHAAACVSLTLSARSGLHALGWSLIENLSLAAVKLVPLGQDDGQRLLRDVAQRLPDVVAKTLAEPKRTPANFAPMLAILSSRHESQYSRLFRS